MKKNTIDQLRNTAQLLKAIAHPMRLKIIHILLDKNISVGELAAECKIPHNIACHHLLLLSTRGILERQRHGTKAYYQVVEPVYWGIIECLSNPPSFSAVAK